MTQISTCCKAPVQAIIEGEGTGFFMCSKCEKPCDAIYSEEQAAAGTTNTGPAIEGTDGISDLKLYSTEDLLRELAVRAPCGVVGMTRPAKDPSRQTYKLRWWGDAFKAAGLCSGIQEEINRDRNDNEESINTDDF